MACSHVLPIRLLDTPLSLTAGGADTPAPLGAAVLSLADSKRKPLLTGLPGYRPIAMRLAWQDMATPALDRDDWVWLAGRLTALPTKRLHVHCQMGHGRTGTALAILCSLWNVIPEGQCPVTWVRTMYCPKAVETQGQLDYVARITGRPVSAEPSMAAYPVATGAPLTGGWSRDGGQTTFRDPYASEDYFQTGLDTPPAGYGRDYTTRPSGGTPTRSKRRADEDSLGARRERFQRHLPDVSRPAAPPTETRIIPRATVSETPTARFPVRYPPVPLTDGAVGEMAEAPPETPARPAGEPERTAEGKGDGA